MSQYETNSDEQLEQLLQSASWPATDETQLKRLEEHWASVLDQEQVQLTQRSGWTRNIPWILAAAASLVIGCAIWMTIEKNNDRSENKPNERIVDAKSATDEREHNFTSPADSPTDLVTTEPPKLSRDDYLNVLARNRNKRTSSSSLQPTIYQRLVESVSTRIGQSPLAAAATQTAIRELDRTLVTLRASRKIKSRQWKQYAKARRNWEKWAWQFADSKKSAHQMGSLRFAVAVSTDQSLNRLSEMLAIDGIGNDAAMAIATHGNARSIDRAVSRASSTRAKKQLMLAMLKQPGQQPALMFLRYLRDPATNSLAVEIANSTDQLPAEIWMASIANRDHSRFDAAMAVSQVCDKRVVNGLIQMATQPSTSRPAMMALIKSTCTDAQSFIAFAETNQQLSGQLWMARRKLQQLEMESSRLEKRNDFQRTF